MRQGGPKGLAPALPEKGMQGRTECGESLKLFSIRRYSESQDRSRDDLY